MIRKIVAAAALSAVAACTAPPAYADGSCQFPVVVIALAGPVTLICGDGNIATTNHSTNVTIDPSLQVNPHLLTPAP